MATLHALHVADDLALWERLGFRVVGGRTSIDGVDVVFSEPSEARRGLWAWDLDVEATSIDGAPVVADPGPRAAGLSPNPNGVDGFDHLVLSTPDLERTIASLESLGLPCRRRRDAGAYGSATMLQAFFWLDTPSGARLILELAGPSTPDPDASKPASFFGLALTCSDLDATCAFYGDLTKPPFEAVQPGRRITTLSSRAGCSVSLAFMSPHLP